MDEGFERMLACFHFPLMEAKMNQKSGGPRTPQGKERSKFNALKHGLFSKIILLKWESPAVYLSLVNGLRDGLQPQGSLEAVLVENLAALFWRKRRLFIAENAEISQKMEFTESDFIANQYVEAWDCSRAAIASGGLLKYIFNPLVIREAKEMLLRARAAIIMPRFAEDSRIFKKLYGQDQDGGTPNGLRLFYELHAMCAELALQHGDKSVCAELTENLVALIDCEIERLTRLEKALETEERQRLEHKSSAAIIPGQEVSDRLLRYETHLSREIEKVLNQLERWQRMRKGQPVPPPVDVNISA
jgi:hypothetical protein